MTLKRSSFVSWTCRVLDQRPDVAFPVARQHAGPWGAPGLVTPDSDVGTSLISVVFGEEQGVGERAVGVGDEEVAVAQGLAQQRVAARVNGQWADAGAVALCLAVESFAGLSQVGSCETGHLAVTVRPCRCRSSPPPGRRCRCRIAVVVAPNHRRIALGVPGSWS